MKLSRKVSFGARLGALLSKASLTQSEFARRIGVVQSAVSGWVDGSKHPRHARLEAIANALGVAPSELLAAEVAPARRTDKRTKAKVAK